MLHAIGVEMRTAFRCLGEETYRFFQATPTMGAIGMQVVEWPEHGGPGWSFVPSREGDFEWVEGDILIEPYISFRPSVRQARGTGVLRLEGRGERVAGTRVCVVLLRAPGMECEGAVGERVGAFELEDGKVEYEVMLDLSHYPGDCDLVLGLRVEQCPRRAAGGTLIQCVFGGGESTHLLGRPALDYSPEPSRSEFDDVVRMLAEDPGALGPMMSLLPRGSK